MGNRSYTKVFNDREKLQEMLGRYEAGEHEAVLGAAYGCDRSSILFQVQKHGLWKPIGPGRLRPGLRKYPPDFYNADGRLIRSKLPDARNKGSSRERTWDGRTHACCKSQTSWQHKLSCPRLAAGLLLTNMRPLKTAALLPGQTPHKHKYAHVFEEPVNPGKSYTQYVADDQRRAAARRKINARRPIAPNAIQP